MRTLIPCAILVALAACAQEVVWQKPGATERDLAQDADGCRARAFAGQGAMGGNAQQSAIVYETCMESKGWSRVSAKKP